MNYIYGVVLVLIAFLGWEVKHQHEGRVKAQLELRDYRTAQAQAVADAQRDAAEKLKQAETNNATIMADLQGKLDGSDKRADDLSHRLQLALAHPHPGSLPQVPDQPPAPSPSGESGGAEAARLAFAAYDSACQRDAARLDALIGEARPQIAYFIRTEPPALYTYTINRN